MILYYILTELMESIYYYSLFQLGDGELFIGLTKSQSQTIGQGVGQFVGNINNFNFWSRFLSHDDVKWMSDGCGMTVTSVLGRPLISWTALSQSYVGQLQIKRPATCKDVEGKQCIN